MSDIIVEVTDYQLVNFLSTPIGIVSTDFRLTKAEKDVIMNTQYNEPRGDTQGVLVSENHKIGSSRSRTHSVLTDANQPHAISTSFSEKIEIPFYLTNKCYAIFK